MPEHSTPNPLPIDTLINELTPCALLPIMQVPEHSTPNPLPIDTLINANFLARKAHESISGIKVNQLGFQHAHMGAIWELAM